MHTQITDERFSCFLVDLELSFHFTGFGVLSEGLKH